MRIVNIETIQHNIHMIITPRPLCPGLWHWQLWCRPARHHDREHFYNISTDFSSNPLCLRRFVFQCMFVNESSCRLIFANTVLIVEMVFTKCNVISFSRFQSILMINDPVQSSNDFLIPHIAMILSWFDIQYPTHHDPIIWFIQSVSSFRLIKHEFTMYKCICMN